MSLSRPSPRLRRLAASTGALALAGTLALSGVAGGGVEMTEAAWSDAEVAQATVKAEWPVSFASVVSGSARSSNPTVNGDSNMTYQSTFRWTTQLTDPASGGTETSTDRPTYTRTLDEKFLGPGVNSATVNLGKDPWNYSLHNWDAVPAFTNPGTRADPSTTRCLAISTTFAPQSNCGQTGGIASASNTTQAFGFSIGNNTAFKTFLNAANLSTAVNCTLSSATATDPTGRVDLGTEQGGTNPYLYYSGILGYGNNMRTIWSSSTPGHDQGFTLSSGTLSGFWTIAEIADRTRAKVMPVITKKTTANPPYAIAEIAAYVEIYGRASALSTETLRAKMYFVLSRSECGVKPTSASTLPPQASVFPLNGMPGGNTLAAAATGYSPRYWPAEFVPAGRPGSPVSLRATSADEAAAAELPPTTTVTSPLENSTASETTTSAPPNPSGEGESSTSGTSTAAATSTTRRTTTVTSTVPTVTAAPTSASAPPATQVTTSTSAAPAIVLPDEPGDLPATARTEEVGTVLVNGDELDVVVAGDTVPTGARTALTALDTWIADARQPSGDWTAFTSDDPDADGWRWAAINGKTGTVVYIR